MKAYSNKPVSDIRIAAMLPKTKLGSFLKIFSPLLDRLLGIKKLHDIYNKNNLSGLEKQALSKKLLSLLGVEIIGEQSVIDNIPATGSCIVVCNHPYGMIEGVIIAYLLTRYRSDTKVMANIGLKVFKEINDYFIFANPLNPKDKVNISAIKSCFKHINNGGLLVIFPAGMVSSFQKDKQRITDASWNRLAINLSDKTDAPILPVFISGKNSRAFHFMGSLYFRFRLLMLAHEMFKLKHHKITLRSNHLLSNKQLSEFKTTTIKNNFIRAQCYLNDRDYLHPWKADTKVEAFEDIMAPQLISLMESELSLLPSKQHLITFKSFSVYYGYLSQIPACVKEITRLREITFRTLNEGSGKSCDTDKFDATYMHLFTFDHKKGEIIGAYRIGQTDVLLKDNDLSKLYLSQIFNFKTDFINQKQACLEMGRSFIIKEHQNSFYGLLLLWKGIGAFVCQNPHYRTLYGTVSLSKVYDPRSVSLINEVIVTDRDGVSAKTPFKSMLHPEMNEFIQNNKIKLEQLSALIQGIEKDGKDIPVLLKQYYKLDANFHCTGIDSNFNHTPGLLLSVNLPKAPDRLLKLYLGKNKEEYLNYKVK